LQFASLDINSGCAQSSEKLSHIVLLLQKKGSVWFLPVRWESHCKALLPWSQR